jgi:hypothetical protein
MKAGNQLSSDCVGQVRQTQTDDSPQANQPEAVAHMIFAWLRDEEAAFLCSTGIAALPITEICAMHVIQNECSSRTASLRP